MMMICPLCRGSHDLSACPRWRLPAVLCVLMLTMCAPVPAVEVDGNRVTLSKEEMELCAQGGCVLITNRSLAEIRKALVLLMDEVDARKTCRRGEFI